MDLAETEVLLFQTCGEDIELSDEPKFLKGVDNRNFSSTTVCLTFDIFVMVLVLNFHLSDFSISADFEISYQSVVIDTFELFF